jgi:protein tyrosine/serine phosphatase
MISERDIPNFHVVHPYLWRGAAPTEEGLRVLKASGVRTIIDLRISPKKVAAERRLVEAMGLRFINLPMSGDPPTTRQIETFLATSTSAEQQPVFIHCQHGADRTGTLLGIYRERVEGWDFDRAYKEMRRYGFDPRWRKLTATVRRYAPPDPARSRGGQERP